MVSLLNGIEELISYNFSSFTLLIYVQIAFACQTVDPKWKIKCDGIIVVELVEFGLKYIGSVWEDKATNKQNKEDRCRVAEIGRFILDSIRLQCPTMKKDELTQLRIPGVHSAFSQIDFFLSSWIYEPGNSSTHTN